MMLLVGHLLIAVVELLLVPLHIATASLIHMLHFSRAIIVLLVLVMHLLTRLSTVRLLVRTLPSTAV